jgi:LemA protein
VRYWAWLRRGWETKHLIEEGQAKSDWLGDWNVSIIIVILSGLVAVPLLFVLITYNGLISDRNMADNAFSSIDIMLQRRWDLIPNLVAAVKGYMDHESQVLTRVTELRTQAMTALSNSQRLTAEDQLTGALGQLRAVIENYPDLKASDSMLHLQRSLSECEEQIAAARRTFNAAVLQYNNRCQMFPQMWVAQIFGFRTRDFFGIEESQRANPQIQWND